MIRARIPETGTGITGEAVVEDYDEFQRGMRKRGLVWTKELTKSGITAGRALEIGPGPGYAGLEWLKNTAGTSLTGLEISPDMKRLAEKNAGEYGFMDRVRYVLSDASKRFPFEDGSFDAVFSTGSLHEWPKPVEAFNEIGRVLKKGGLFLIGDLKRNINPFMVVIMKSMAVKKSMKLGLISSIRSAYILSEATELLRNSSLADYSVAESPFGIVITGVK